MKEATNIKKRGTRANKPLIEKRRRDRINTCLIQLKGMIINSKQNEFIVSPHKLEKADILELTVKHVKDLMSCQKQDTYTQEMNLESSYQEGFKSCIREAMQHIEEDTGLSKLRKWQLINSIHESNALGDLVDQGVFDVQGVRQPHKIHSHTLEVETQMNYPVGETLEHNVLKAILGKFEQSQGQSYNSHVDSVPSDPTQFILNVTQNSTQTGENVNIDSSSREIMTLTNQKATPVNKGSENCTEMVFDRYISSDFFKKKINEINTNHQYPFTVNPSSSRNPNTPFKNIIDNSNLQKYTHRKKDWILNYTNIMNADTNQSVNDKLKVNTRQPKYLYINSSVWRPW